MVRSCWGDLGGRPPRLNTSARWPRSASTASKSEEIASTAPSSGRGCSRYLAPAWSRRSDADRRAPPAPAAEPWSSSQRGHQHLLRLPPGPRGDRPLGRGRANREGAAARRRCRLDGTAHGTKTSLPTATGFRFRFSRTACGGEALSARRAGRTKTWDGELAVGGIGRIDAAIRQTSGGTPSGRWPKIGARRWCDGRPPRSRPGPSVSRRDAEVTAPPPPTAPIIA